VSEDAADEEAMPEVGLGSALELGSSSAVFDDADSDVSVWVFSDDEPGGGGEEVSKVPAPVSVVDDGSLTVSSAVEEPTELTSSVAEMGLEASVCDEAPASPLAEESDESLSAGGSMVTKTQLEASRLAVTSNK
jgi:hypothetical protein